MTEQRSYLPILLAGGMGTRLHPITADLPKPLIPVDGVPAICRILDTLDAIGYRKAVVTVRYLADEIISALGTRYRGISLSYSREDGTGRGTAGGVRAAWDVFGEGAAGALVISGDAVFTCDLDALTSLCKEKAADAVILCTRVSDPSAYGTVHTDGDGRITAFVEKPCVAEAVTDLVNTGIYCLSRAFLERIPTTGAPDFGTDVFGAALRRGDALYACRGEGYWCDIGSFSSYLACSRAISRGEIRTPHTAQMRQRAPQGTSDCSLGRKCTLGTGAFVRRSILFDNVHVGAGASVTGSILCRGVHIGDGAIVEEGCVLGSGATVGAGVHLGRRTHLAPGEAADTDTKLQRVGRTGSSGDPFASDDAARYLCDVGYLLSGTAVPEKRIVYALAYAAAELARRQGADLFVCAAEQSQTVRTAMHLLTGVLGRLDVGCVTVCDGVLALSAARMPHLRIRKTPGAGLYRIVLLTQGGIPAAAVFDSVGLSPDRAAERILDAAFSDALASPRLPFPSASTAPARLHTAYAAALLTDYCTQYARTPLPAGSADVTFSTGHSPQERLLAALLTKIGAREHPDAKIRFSVAAPGEAGADILCPLTATDLRAPGKTVCSHWTLTALLTAYRASAKYDVRTVPYPTARTGRYSGSSPSVPLSLPLCAPHTIPSDLRYTHTPTLPSHADERDAAVRARMLAAVEAEDAVLLARSIMYLLAAEGASLGTLTQQHGISPAACRRCIVTPQPSASPDAPILSLSSSLCRLSEAPDAAFSPATEGMVHHDRAGNAVRIVASRTGSFRIVADAFSAETAEALCGFARERLFAVLVSARQTES